MRRPPYANKQLGGLRFLYVCMSAQWCDKGDEMRSFAMELLLSAEDVGGMIQQIQTRAALWAGAAE